VAFQQRPFYLRGDKIFVELTETLCEMRNDPMFLREDE
jgi:hypothetical protein